MKGVGLEYTIAFASILAIIVILVLVYYLLKSRTTYASMYKR